MWARNSIPPLVAAERAVSLGSASPGERANHHIEAVQAWHCDVGYSEAKVQSCDWPLWQRRHRCNRRQLPFRLCLQNTCRTREGPQEYLQQQWTGDGRDRSTLGYLTPNEHAARPAPQSNGPGTLRYMGPPRPDPLQTRCRGQMQQARDAVLKITVLKQGTSVEQRDRTASR
jgi:hypothetical protein